MNFVSAYQAQFLAYLQQQDNHQEPLGLYEPIRYIMQLGGKRLRPILVLMAADAYGVKPEKALPAALAIEVFHNFTLIHDDIMDAAPLRRGKPTVHKKWNLNTGILAGDAMLIQAYQQFENYDPTLCKPLLQLFSKTALEVCEGQQYDVEFEDREDVKISEYLHMIEYKTAVLVAAALQMGALIAGAEEEDQQHIYHFGLHLGIAFQLQDDYLDTFGDEASFGKKIGGDIAENKKTYLYLKSLELATEQDAQQLRYLYSIQPKDATAKIKQVQQLFTQCGGDQASLAAIENYTHSAFQSLAKLSISPTFKAHFTEFGKWLMGRNS